VGSSLCQILRASCHCEMRTGCGEDGMGGDAEADSASGRLYPRHPVCERTMTHDITRASFVVYRGPKPARESLELRSDEQYVNRQRDIKTWVPARAYQGRVARPQDNV
jgi:hypothetical protein